MHRDLFLIACFLYSVEMATIIIRRLIYLMVACTIPTAIYPCLDNNLISLNPSAGMPSIVSANW